MIFAHLFLLAGFAFFVFKMGGAVALRRLNRKLRQDSRSTGSKP
jgi:hypothetical protein